MPNFQLNCGLISTELREAFRIAAEIASCRLRNRFQPAPVFLPTTCGYFQRTAGMALWWTAAIDGDVKFGRDNGEFSSQLRKNAAVCMKDGATITLRVVAAKIMTANRSWLEGKMLSLFISYKRNDLRKGFQPAAELEHLSFRAASRESSALGWKSSGQHLSSQPPELFNGMHYIVSDAGDPAVGVLDQFIGGSEYGFLFFRTHFQIQLNCWSSTAELPAVHLCALSSVRETQFPTSFYGELGSMFICFGSLWK